MTRKTKKEITSADMYAGASKVKSLLIAGADVDTRFEEELTPLIIAAVHGDSATIDILLSLGAKLDPQQNGKGMTALMKAALWGHTKIAAKLIAAGAQVDLQTGNGWTALMYAVLSEKVDLVAMLLQAGANPKAQDNRGRTALHYAQEREYLQIATLLKDASH